MFIFVITLLFKVGIMDRVQIISVRHWSAILAAWVNTIIRHKPVAPGYAPGDVSGFAPDVLIKKFTTTTSNRRWTAH